MIALYVATDGDLYKIGISARPEKRMREHGSGVRLVETWERPYAKDLECCVKGILSHRRARGSEWFRISESEMLFQVRRAVRIFDDEQAIKDGKEPSPRLAAC